MLFVDLLYLITETNNIYLQSSPNYCHFRDEKHIKQRIAPVTIKIEYTIWYIHDYCNQFHIYHLFNQAYSGKFPPNKETPHTK